MYFLGYRLVYVRFMVCSLIFVYLNLQIVVYCKSYFALTEWREAPDVDGIFAKYLLLLRLVWNCI